MIHFPQGGDGFHHYKVRARLAISDRKFKEAESIYLEGVSQCGALMFLLFKDERETERERVCVCVCMWGDGESARLVQKCSLSMS